MDQRKPLTTDPNEEIVTILSTTTPIANREHSCFQPWCKEPIHKGERYRRIVYLDKARNFTSCCEHLRHSLMADTLTSAPHV